ncbi:hypothetical protein QE152_g6361 [Popillia japonica]|uniref:Uncharacterized protein n=1 Tax=Popillia japonica TaxID=7064 RepID=A0AAW1MI86_POPJA
MLLINATTTRNISLKANLDIWKYGWCLRDIANMIVSQPTAEIETPLEKPQPIEQETKDNESDVKRQYRWSIRNMTNVMTIQPKTKIETLPEKINPTENNEDNLEKECVYLVETKFLGKAISAEEEALIRSRLAAEEETQEIRKNNIKEDDSDVRDIIVDILWESIIAINASASESSGTKRKTVQVGNDGGRGWISNFPLELRNELFDAEMSLLILCDHNRWRELEHLTDDYTRLEYRQQYSW